MGNCISTNSDNYMYDDDVESNILFLEEKKQILKKARFRKEKEQAYVALNAYAISNRREPYSRHTECSSIWSEAKKIVKKLKLSGGIGSRSEEDEGNSQDSMSSAVGGVEGQSTSSQSEPEICSLTSSIAPSLSESCENGVASTRKRRRIDLSMVKKMTSKEFTKEYIAKEIDRTRSEDECDHESVAERKETERNHAFHTARWQQAREMLLAMDARKWISEAELKHILV